MTSFKQQLVSSLQDKPPSEPQKGVRNLQQKPEPSLRTSSVGAHAFLLAGLLSVRYAPVSEGTKACKEAKA